MLPYKDDPAIYLFIGGVILCKHSKSYLPKPKALLRLFLEFQFKGIQNSRESVSRRRITESVSDLGKGPPGATLLIWHSHSTNCSYFFTNNQEMLLYLADFALQEQAEDKLMVAFF